MDEEYVQEHILTGGIVAPVGDGLADSFMAAYSHSLGVVVSYPTHLWRASRIRDLRCAWLRVRLVAAPEQQRGAPPIATTGPLRRGGPRHRTSATIPPVKICS